MSSHTLGRDSFTSLKKDTAKLVQKVVPTGGEEIQLAQTLVRLADAMELTAAEMGPAVGATAGKIGVTLSVEAETPLDAGRRAAEVFLPALMQSLVATSAAPTLERVLVERVRDHTIMAAVA